MGVKANKTLMLKQINTKLKEFKAELPKAQAALTKKHKDVAKAAIKVAKSGLAQAERLMDKDEYSKVADTIRKIRTDVPNSPTNFAVRYHQPNQPKPEMTVQGIEMAIAGLERLKSAIALAEGDVIELPARTFEEVARSGIEALL
ncbi:MAG: hypothetical protein KOO63_07865 [Bacteroidales bacterium]|nr:hypothetical protein [Candidatus Latescibacterota bacterium]